MSGLVGYRTILLTFNEEDGDDFTSSGKEIPDTDPHISGSSTFAGLPKSGQEDNKAADESPSAARGERRKLEQELRKKQGQRGGESAQRKRQRLASDEVARKRAKPEPEPAPEVLSEEEENEDVLAFVREMRLPPVGSSATKRHMQREHMRR